MDIDKLIALFTQYVSDWLRIFIGTLLNVKSAFTLEEVPGAPRLLVLTEPSSNINKKDMWLSKGLFAYVIISIWAGLMIVSASSRQSTTELASATTIVVLLWWTFSSLVNYGVCKLMRGRANLPEHLSLSFQVFATIYVVSAVIAVIAKKHMPNLGQSITCELTTRLPVSLQTLLILWAPFLVLSIYLSIGMRRIHTLSFLKTATLFVIALGMSALSIGFSVIGDGEFRRERVFNYVGHLPPNCKKLFPWAN